MVRIESPEDSFVKTSDNFFFDANIWLYIHYLNVDALSKSDLDLQYSYTGIYQNIKEVDASIFIHSSVLNEVIKVILKDQLKQFISFTRKLEPDKNYLTFKNDFRSTSKYTKALAKVYNVLQSIVDDSIILNCDIPDVNKFLELLRESEEIDSNDLLYLELCNRNNLIFVTHDCDCRSYRDDVTLITTNKRLLSYQRT